MAIKRLLDYTDRIDRPHLGYQLCRSALYVHDVNGHGLRDALLVGQGAPRRRLRQRRMVWDTIHEHNRGSCFQVGWAI